MRSDAVEFEVEYTSELIDEAATAFVRQYLYRRYAAGLSLACFISTAGLILVLSLGSRDLAAVIGLVAIVVLGPVYFAVVYFTYPAKFSSRLKQALLPSARFCLSMEKLQVRTTAGIVEVAWPKPGSLLEHPLFYLLALSPLAFIIFPRECLPPDALELLQRQRSGRVA